MVNAWRASLFSKHSTVRSLRQILSVDEVSRADRFYFQRDRDHFIVARGILRSILSHYLDLQPNQLEFCYGPHGKPALAAACSGGNLCFNLSHSDGLALYAVTRDKEVGIDIEHARADFPGFQVAEQFFSPREIAVLRALPAARPHEAFFTFWTLKEAYLKSRGQGLSLGLNHLDVSSAMEAPAPLLTPIGEPENLSHWSLRKLAPAPGYAAALAIKGHAGQIKCWHYLYNDSY